jgi:glycerophosphoryl diester phosphodiesterase
MSLIVAHRGLHRPHFDAAENSLASMQGAWSRGIAWCECDVRFARDGTAVLIHDETIGRGEEKTAVAQLAASELRDLGVPSLAEVLAVMPANGGLLIETKQRIDSQFLNWLREVKRAGQVQLHTFHLEDLLAMATAGFWAAAIIDDEKWIDAAIASPAAGVHVSQKILNRELAGRFRNGGKSVGVWTVNKRAAMKKFVAIGVDRLISDDPLAALSFFVRG